jgi:heat shock protein HslJ
MNVRLLTGIILITLLGVTVGACAPQANLSGTLQVYVTDAPPGEQVTSIMVTISEVQVHIAKAEREQEQSTSDNKTPEQEQDSGGEWITIDLNDNATTFDLLEIRGIEQYLGASEVATGKYTQVRLVVDTIQVAFGDGELQDATVPSNELKIVRPFDVIAGETTILVLDFEADKMVNVTGANKIIVKPVVKLTVRQEKGGGDQNGSVAGEIGLEDRIWVLKSYGESENMKDVLENTEITATFNKEEGQVTGSAGCNSYFAGYEVEDANLSHGPIGATEMSCGEQKDIQEREYLGILQDAESYEIEDGKLTINCGNQFLIFESK